MKIKITKSSSEHYWYANHIGETFILLPSVKKRYKSRGFGFQVVRDDMKNKILYFVNPNDCEIVT